MRREKRFRAMTNDEIESGESGLIWCWFVSQQWKHPVVRANAFFFIRLDLPFVRCGGLVLIIEDLKDRVGDGITKECDKKRDEECKRDEHLSSISSNQQSKDLENS